MKKFVFTLQSLKEVKETQEKQAKQELAQAEQHVMKLSMQIDSLQQQFKNQSDAFHEKLTQGADAGSLIQFSNFFDFLQKELDAAQKELEKAKEQRRKCQEKLIALMKELKMLDNLYQSQYEEYLDELKKEEEKSIGDLVSYQVVSGQEGRKADD